MYKEEVSNFINRISCGVDLILKMTAICLFIILILFAVIAKENPISIIVALFSLFAILLFFFPIKIETNKSFIIILYLITMSGIIIRLGLSYYYFGPFDMLNFQTASLTILRGLNVYQELPFYNYTPVWFNILGMLMLYSKFLSIPFHFMVKCFLTIIDFFTLIVLLEIGSIEEMSKTELIRLSIFFFLNPVSFLITGYHGQFENLALFFIILGLYFYYIFQKGNDNVKYVSWFFFTIGLIIKHDTIVMVLSGIVNLFKKLKLIALFFFFSIIFFISTFIFYWSTGSQGIINNVFLYGGISWIYGFTSFINLPNLKYLFIAALLIYPFFIKNREIVEQFLLGSLFFIAFTTGIGVQYFILPIIFGSLRPSSWFLTYTFITTIVILGAIENLNLYGFSFFKFNATWICALFWFAFAHFKLVEQDKIV